MSKFVRDLAERVGATFVMAFLALYLPPLLMDGAAVENLADLSVLSKAATAGVAAMLSLIKGLLAQRYGNPESASLVRDVEA